MESTQNWIKNLAHQEEQVDKTGQIPYSNPSSTPSEEELREHTVEFLKQLRVAFTQSISFFNQLKGYMGSIRIYGITGREADFMLFRGGSKMIFSMKEAGLIMVRFSSLETSLPGQEHSHHPADYIKGVWGAFGELKWTYNNQAIRIDYLIRHYMTHFARSSLR